MPDEDMRREFANSAPAQQSQAPRGYFPSDPPMNVAVQPRGSGSASSFEPPDSSGFSRRRPPELATRAISFGLVGGFVALVSFVLLYALVQYLGLNENLAYFIQAIISIELNFFLNYSLTWRDRRGSGFAAFAAVWGRFHLTRIVTVALNQALFTVFVFMGVHYLIANALCIIIVMAINFLVGDKFIFRSYPVIASLVEVSTLDLVNPEVVTEPQLTAMLKPRALPRTGWPTVSVVVPVGPNKTGVEPTVATLLQQDYPGEVEIILVGACNDPAWDEIRWYIDDELVTIVEADPGAENVSLGAQRLAGVGHAHGQILASLDSGAAAPHSWISIGVKQILAGWPCVIGPTAVFTQAGRLADVGDTSSIKGRVLDPERFVEADYTPPIAANIFLAGDVLPVIVSAKAQTGVNSEDYLEWLWNLARADVAIYETPATGVTLARSLSMRQLLTQYMVAGAALARFARAALNTATLPPQRLRLAGAFLAPAALLALLIAAIMAPNWPFTLEMRLGQVLARAIPAPAGWTVILIALACVLAAFMLASAAAIVRTGQRRAALAPLYRLAYSWSMIVTGFAAALRLPSRAATMKFPQFSVVHAPDQAFTRPMPVIPEAPTGSTRRRQILSTQVRRSPPYAPAVQWPSVSVIIPVKDSQATIGAAVDSLLRQDYQGRVEILLVGDVNDPTWEPIRHYIRSGQVRIIETTVQTAYRDANAKRTIGLAKARGEILALTDSDMALPNHWISTGVQYILRGWPCVGGPMRGATGSFWDAYADLVSLGSMTPRFVVNRVVDDKRFGLPHHKPPITANVFMTRDALKTAGDFDPTFVHDYEDYSWCWTACKSGIPLLCTPTLQGDHYHRQGWQSFIRQYTRSGRGCADFVMKYPESPLSRIRVFQWLCVGAMLLSTLGVAVAGVAAIVATGSLDTPIEVVHTPVLSVALDTFDALALISLISVGLLGLGILNALTVRQARAVIFPFITVIFGLAFSFGMAFEFATRLPGKLARYLSLHQSDVATLAIYAGLLALSAGLRLWDVGSRPGFEWDEPVYTSVASGFAHFGVVEYKSPIGQSPIYLAAPPFYFMMLGEWFRAVGSGVAQARVFSVIMSLAMITILFMYLRQRLGRWALLPTALVALDGWIVFANRISWIDNAVVVFGVLSIWVYFHALKRNTARAFMVAGLAFGFTLVYKQLGIYFCAIPVMNWLLSRQRTRGHVVMLATVGGCALLYLGAMTALYGDLFWAPTLAQFSRANGAAVSRGVVSNPQEVLTALVGQYQIFTFTVLLCGAALIWLGYDIIHSLLRKDVSWLHRYSLEASWIIASIAVFIAIQIKFPNYFIYLMVPLLVYLGMRIRDVVTNWRANDIRGPRWLWAGVILLPLLALGCDVGASYVRLATHNDNALLQVSNYAKSHIPVHDKVVADEPVGVMIPQPYCKPDYPGQCQDAKWVITYTSITQQLPTRASDAELYVLLDNAREVAVFRGFKETITVYHVDAGTNTPPPPNPDGSPTPSATTTPGAAPTATPTPVINSPPPSATATPKAVPTATATATPAPVPTATPTTPSP